MKKIFLFIISALAANFVEAQPCSTITAVNVTQPLCFGQSNGSISIDYTSCTPPYTIIWSSPISQTTTSTALTQSITGVPSGMYTFTLTCNGGCSTSQQVNVNQPAFVVLNVSPNETICYGQSALIYAAAGGGTAPYNYVWTPNIGSGGGPHSVNPTTSTQYTVSMSDNNGCSPSPKIITVNVRPPLGLIASSYTVCEGDNIMLSPTITSPGNGGPYDFMWSNGMTTSSISVISNTPTPNTYTVTVDDHCTIPTAIAVFTINVQTCTGIDELTKYIPVSVYPNPSDNLFYIESKHLLKLSIVEIYNVTGEKVKSDFLIDSITPLNLESLPNGIYSLQIKNNNQIIYNKKIIKKG